MNRMKRLGEALPDALEELGLAASARAAQAVVLWPDVAGPHSAAHSCAIAFHGGVLTIATEHSGWSQELELLKEDLLAEYRRRLGRGVVKRLRFEVNQSQVRARATRRSKETTGHAPDDLLPATGPAVARRRGEHADADIARLLDRIYEEEARQRQQQASGVPVCLRCGAPNPRRGRLCPACRVEERTG